MKKTAQTYQYKVADSILGKTQDEYAFSENEYYRIYSFFVTYSMCGTQSAKKRTFSDYGWSVENVKNTTLGVALENVLNLNRNPDFVFTDKDELAIQFNSKDLPDGALMDVDKERAVISKTSEKNKYLKLFYRIRNGFAHGKFILRLSSQNEKMVIIQDDNGHNVTARIVIKLKTLLNYVNTVDINGLTLYSLRQG
ncbi:MAG: hypothetical protein PHF05_09760 [Candidatus Izemoplasmatales bacterium]|nr:hypothetical protein [Acholeplasmataceae bacterium]MDD4070713.1 hypothetical protein [Candidatus Izemoplasmatales bacterium]